MKRNFSFRDVICEWFDFIICSYMEKFNCATVHSSMPSDSLSASPPNTTQRFSVFLVVLSLAPIPCLDAITEMILIYTRTIMQFYFHAHLALFRPFGEIVGKANIWPSEAIVCKRDITHMHHWSVDDAQKILVLSEGAAMIIGLSMSRIDQAASSTNQLAIGVRASTQDRKDSPLGVSTQDRKIHPWAFNLLLIMHILGINVEIWFDIFCRQSESRFLIELTFCLTAFFNCACSSSGHSWQ